MWTVMVTAQAKHYVNEFTVQLAGTQAAYISWSTKITLYRSAAKLTVHIQRQCACTVLC